MCSVLIFFPIKVRHISKNLNVSESRKRIASNLTCIEKEPDQGKTLFYFYQYLLPYMYQNAQQNNLIW